MSGDIKWIILTEKVKGSALNLLIKILQRTSWLTLEESSLQHRVLTAGCREVNVNVTPWLCNCGPALKMIYCELKVSSGTKHFAFRHQLSLQNVLQCNNNSVTSNNAKSNAHHL